MDLRGSRNVNITAMIIPCLVQAVNDPFQIAPYRCASQHLKLILNVKKLVDFALTATFCRAIFAVKRKQRVDKKF